MWMAILGRCKSLLLPIAALSFLQLQTAAGAGEKPLRVAVFDFELIDTSLEGAERGKDPAEAERLKLISDELRTMLDQSARYRVTDIAPAAKAIADAGF